MRADPYLRAPFAAPFLSHFQVKLGCITLATVLSVGSWLKAPNGVPFVLGCSGQAAFLNFRAKNGNEDKDNSVEVQRRKVRR